MHLKTHLRRILFILAGFMTGLWLVAPVLAAGYEAIEIVPTRPNVTVRLLVIKANSKAQHRSDPLPGGGRCEALRREGRPVLGEQEFSHALCQGSCHRRVYRRGSGCPFGPELRHVGSVPDLTTACQGYSENHRLPQRKTPCDVPLSGGHKQGNDLGGLPGIGDRRSVDCGRDPDGRLFPCGYGWRRLQRNR